jgi:hypothetical protein
MDTDSQRERLTKSDDMTQHSPHNLKRAGWPSFPPKWPLNLFLENDPRVDHFTCISI